MMVPKFRAWDDARDEYFEVRSLSFPVSSNDKLGIVATAGDQTAYGPNMILEQYTGLKDVNGKDIYEGDIVTVQATNDDGSTDGMLGKIVYDEDIASFEFTTTGKDGWYTSSFDNLFEEGFFDIHVIGNAHENPELLEGK